MTPQRDQVLEALHRLHEKLAIAINCQDLERVRQIHEIIRLTRETLRELDQLQKSQQVESP